MLLVAAPGQGAQTPAFLAPWLELPGVAEHLASWSELAGCDLTRYGTTATADEIRDTAIAQPLLVAAALAAADVLTGGPRQFPHIAGAAAGHSVGELAAGALAGVIAPGDAMQLTGVRGRAMAQAAAVTPTGMTAVLGGDGAAVLAALDKHGLTPANINAPGQIVAAGTMDQLAGFAADPPSGVRLRPLQVAGAFHTSHMAPAVAALRAAAAGVAVHKPAVALLSNRDGGIVRTGTDWLDRIITQVSAPVRWDQCMQAMTSAGVTAMIELPPAGTLTGLARRALPGVQLLALKTPADLDAAKKLIAEHAHAHADSHAPEWRLVVAPSAGTFRASATESERLDPGDGVGAATALGRVDMRRDSQDVSSGFEATIIEWLVEDGDPVSAGQPIVRLYPDVR